MPFIKRRKFHRTRSRDFIPPPPKYFVFTGKFFVVPAALLLIAGILYLIFRSSFFRVSNILVDGISCTESREFTDVCGALDYPKGKQILFVSEKEIEDFYLSKSIFLQSVRITRRFPNTLIISFVRREPFALFREVYPREFVSSPSAAASQSSVREATGSTYVIDKEGFVLSVATTKIEKIPIFFTPKKVSSIGIHVGGKSESSTLSLVELLQQNKYDVSDIELQGTSIFVTLRDGKELMFSSIKDYSLQLASLQVIVHSLTIEGRTHKRIDLRFEKPIVW